MKKYYNADSTVFLPAKPRGEWEKKLLYGYDSGNPFDVDFHWFRLSRHWKYHDMFRLINLDRFDIIHLDSGGGIFISILAKLSTAKIIRHFHGGGLLASAFDIEDFAEKVTYLLENSTEAKEMGAKGRQWVEINLHPDRYAESLVGVYNQALDNPLI